MRLIDADAYPCQNCEVSYCYQNCKKFNEWLDKTVDAVPVEKYNELKERYERMKEIADILDTALRQYQRQYGE